MWVALYVVCIVLVNWIFMVLAPWSTPFGDLYIANVIVDTLAFQHLAGYLTPAAFTTEVVSKTFGVAVVWYLLKLRAGTEPVVAY